MVKDILEKKGKQPTEILDFILNGIVGVDINPLAVIIARANYLIALGKLLKLGKSIIIPVYVSDSIKLPEIKTIYSYALNEAIQVYEITVNKYRIQIPFEVAKHRYRLGQVLSGLREALNIYRERGDRGEAKALFNRKASEVANQAELEILNMTLDTLFELVDKQLNEIWIYVLNNLYAPIALKEAKFDILTSNPPWIAMRYIENKSYQDWVKQNIFAYGLLSSDQVHLFTQMEIATLFYDRCAELYLNEKSSVIAFVMPRSVLTGAFQHAAFKDFKKPKLKLVKILDCEDVTPLFNVPSCVLIALRGEITQYPVLSTKLAGKLGKKNVHLNEASSLLRVKDYLYTPPSWGKHYSEYYEKIEVGASMYPRCFYFIEFDAHPLLGIDLRKPAVKTSEDIAEKLPWKGIRLKGNVESNFIYATLRSSDILPFGYTKLRSVVLPIRKHQSSYILLDVETLKSMGYSGMGDWLAFSQRLWEEKRTEKSSERFARLIERLNYQRLLEKQNPSKRYVLIYNKSGTDIASCVVDKDQLPKFKVTPSIEIPPMGFVVELESCYYESNDLNEVHYLCAILNSNIINKAIKPLQPKGLFGERHIVKRPFMFPIPKFDSNDSVHLRLAELSKICHEKIAKAKVRFTGKSVASLRKQARETVKDELKEIDGLVSKLLGMG